MEENPHNNNEKSLDDKQYQTAEINGKPIPNAPNEKQQKEMEKTREKLESLKKFICNKYKFVQAIGIIVIIKRQRDSVPEGG